MTRVGDEPHGEACGSAGTRPSFVRNGFAHRECRRCGLLFMWPPPDGERLCAVYASPHEGADEPLSALSWNGSQRFYNRIVSSSVLGALVRATNVMLRATGLGDELIALARRPTDST